VARPAIIGTAVFPDADLKVFLTARAGRRPAGAPSGSLAARGIYPRFRFLDMEAQIANATPGLDSCTAACPARFQGPDDAIE